MNRNDGTNRQGVRNLDANVPPRVAPAPTGMVHDVDELRLVGEIDRLRRDAVNGDPMLKHFRFAHLPAALRKVSRRWAELALATVQDCPRNPERTVALRKLLEGKDAAVRSLVPED